MRRYTDWKEAHTEAQRLANECHIDVAIRKVREFGKIGFNVTFASRNDSNYALAEIVRPVVLGSSDKPEHKGTVLP